MLEEMWPDLRSIHCILCLKWTPILSQNRKYSKDPQNSSEMLKSISIVIDTYVKFGHPNVYERAEHDDKIKGIPGIAKIVLKCE